MQFQQRVATKRLLCSNLGSLSNLISTRSSRRKIQWGSIWITRKISTFRLPSQPLQMTKTRNERGPCQGAHMSISWLLFFVVHVLVLADCRCCRHKSLARCFPGACFGLVSTAKLGVTVKSNCWQGHVCVCAETGHSCVRKVLSYSSWTKRRTWPSAHRALDTILKYHGDSCDTRSLAGATNKLKAWWYLPHNPSAQWLLPTLLQSHATMRSCSWRCWPIFFEVVSPSTALREAQKLMAIFA